MPDKSILRNVNLRPEVYDLIQGESVIRRNGNKGFSLTLNQIILEYFEMRAPKVDPDDREAFAVPAETEDPSPSLRTVSG